MIAGPGEKAIFFGLSRSRILGKNITKRQPANNYKNNFLHKFWLWWQMYLLHG